MGVGVTFVLFLPCTLQSGCITPSTAVSVEVMSSPSYVVATFAATFDTWVGLNSSLSKSSGRFAS